MKIDPKAEDLAREAVVAAIAEDETRFLAAVDNLLAADRKLAEHAIAVYVAVAREALTMIHQGGVPNEEQNREFAEKAHRATSNWSPIQIDDIYQLLEGVSSDKQAPDIPHDRFLTTLFITVGYMLARYYEGLRYDDFYDFLDDLLNRLVAADGAS